MRSILTITLMAVSMAAVGQTPAPTPATIYTPAQQSAHAALDNLQKQRDSLLKQQETLDAEVELNYNKLRDLSEFKNYLQVSQDKAELQKQIQQFQTSQQAAIQALNDANQAAAKAKTIDDRLKQPQSTAKQVSK